MRTSYESSVKPYLEAIAGWARDNVTTKNIARNLGIGYSTFRRYIRDHRDLRDCVRINREEANRLIKAALYRRAVGYEYREETVELVDDQFTVTKIVTKEIPPNTRAIIQWLIHFQSDKWSVKGPNDVKGTFDFGKILEESGNQVARLREEKMKAEAEAAENREDDPQNSDTT